MCVVLVHPAYCRRGHIISIRKRYYLCRSINLSAAQSHIIREINIPLMERLLKNQKNQKNQKREIMNVDTVYIIMKSAVVLATR